MDRIDAILAKHYGFTDEELDFIINYDIKYRMDADDVETDGAVEAAVPAQTFPVTVRDRQLCAFALELANVVRDLKEEMWLDGVVLATKPDLCEKALLDTAKRKRFRDLVQKHRLDLFSGAPIPWSDLRQTLVDAGAICIDSRTGDVTAAAEWQVFRHEMGKLPAGFVTLVADALKNVTGNAADLAEVDAMAVKEAIGLARTEAGVR